jgi:hypothetical protein
MSTGRGNKRARVTRDRDYVEHEYESDVTPSNIIGLGLVATIIMRQYISVSGVE